jgi:hypothetical protein
MADLIDFFGTFDAPQNIKNYTESPAGLILLLNNILRVAIFASGLFALINFLISGIQYIGSSGNPEATKQASGRMWFSFLGLVVATSSLVIAGIIGLVFFGHATAIISPVIHGPTP